MEAQDETEKPLLRCYECAGVNNACGDSSDLGTETTCPAESETCIVATGNSASHLNVDSWWSFLENGDILRMCGRKNEYVPKCVNDDTFCWCSVIISLSNHQIVSALSALWVNTGLGKKGPC